MSRAYQCDVCGLFYDCQSESVGVTARNTLNVQGVAMLDVCPRCADILNLAQPCHSAMENRASMARLFREMFLFRKAKPAQAERTSLINEWINICVEAIDQGEDADAV